MAFHPSFDDCIILFAGQLLELNDFAVIVLECILFLPRAKTAYPNLVIG